MSRQYRKAVNKAVHAAVRAAIAAHDDLDSSFQQSLWVDVVILMRQRADSIELDEIEDAASRLVDEAISNLRVR